MPVQATNQPNAVADVRPRLVAMRESAFELVTELRAQSDGDALIRAADEMQSIANRLGRVQDLLSADAGRTELEPFGRSSSRFRG